MNVIYLHSHDTGRYIEPYGYAVPTPHLQRFAESGVLFRQAFCAGPTCSPSRAALTTGMMPHSCGMLGLSGARGCTLFDYGQHLSHVLRGHGYVTALSGVQHEAPGGDASTLLGYDHLLDQPWPAWADGFEAWNTLYAENAANFILRADPSKPFFLACGFSLTHRMGQGEQWHTMANPPAGDARYVRPPAPLPDTPETRRDFADFRVAAGLLDAAMGRVLEAVETAGIADETLVIVTTDHGLASPMMKCNLTDHGTGVMLMLRGPGGFAGGKVMDAMVSHLDLFPTLCELGALPPPAWLQGRSLVPLVRGETDRLHDALFAEVNWHGRAEPMRAVRTERFKYIRRYLLQPGSENCDRSVSRTWMREHGWDEREVPRESLYDLAMDPNEAANLAADPAYAEPLAELRARLDAWMEETADPLLSGRLEPRPGMTIRGDGEHAPGRNGVPATAIEVVL